MKIIFAFNINYYNNQMKLLFAIVKVTYKELMNTQLVISSTDFNNWNIAIDTTTFSIISSFKSEISVIVV